MAEHPTRCRFPWCEATTHTPTDLFAAHHHGHTTTFPGVDGTTIGVTIVHAERPGWFPHIAVTRSAGTLAAQVDLIPGDGWIWGEILAALNPADLIRFAAAIAQSATQVGGQEEATP